MERLKVPKTPEEAQERIRRSGVGPSLDVSSANAQRDCEECGGTGWVERERCAYRCPCTTAAVAADGVPKEFRLAALNNYREDAGNRIALARARGFLAGDRDFYLFGDVGSGKTRLACSILNEHAKQRRTALFVRVPWMLQQLQPGREEASVLEERISNTSLLVLDDLGAERDQATDYTRRTLLMLYEQRHDLGLRTIFTSNKSVQEIADMQDDRRLASRIIGCADVVQVATPDQRRARRTR